MQFLYFTALFLPVSKEKCSFAVSKIKEKCSFKVLKTQEKCSFAVPKT